MVGGTLRGDQLSRQWLVLKRIEGSQTGLTAAEIADLGGKSLRTAYRDLDDLQKAGFPMYTENSESGQRWRLLDSFRVKIPAPFTLTELLALHVSRDLCRVLQGTVFFESIESLFHKLQTLLPRETIEYLDRIVSSFQTGIRPYRNYAHYRELVQQVNRAVVDRKRIDIIYHALRSKEETRRKIDPYALWLYEGTIYIVGKCHLRDQIRMFVLDRIRMMQVLDEGFEIPEDFDLENHVRHGFKVMTDELYTVRIWISPEWARYISERIWHESQHIQKQFDGAIELTFRVAGLDEIKQWVLSLGPEAKVLEPTELIDFITRSLQDTLGQYEGMDLGYGEPESAEVIEIFEQNRLW